LKTKDNSDLNLVLALNYSAREDIIDGVKKISKEIVNNNISEQDITADLFSNYLSTSDIPSPELLIRTSGEIRISNFLLWEIAYTELYFTDVFWPDFKREDFLSAIVEYQNRERRFGMVSEQI
jgi:undecaprenyl diphosphate synthase